MSETIVLEAELRSDVGKGASRRLRRLEEKVPAIIYGGSKEPVNITLTVAPLRKAMEEESFYTQVLTLNVAGASESVLVKDLQRHPARGDAMHLDFVRVDLGKAVHVNVPLHFINEETCVGVKVEGGKILHSLAEVEVVCLPNAIPEYIEIDMLEVSVGTHIHLSDLKLPEGVEIAQLALGEDHDLQVAVVNKPRGGAEDEGEGDESED